MVCCICNSDDYVKFATLTATMTKTTAPTAFLRGMSYITNYCHNVHVHMYGTVGTCAVIPVRYFLIKHHQHHYVYIT